MRFHPIHPSIVDLYINTLTLHLLHEELGRIGPNGLTDEFKDHVDIVSSSFAISARTAERLFGSSDAVQDQLNIFTGSMGEA